MTLTRLLPFYLLPHSLFIHSLFCILLYLAFSFSNLSQAEALQASQFSHPTSNKHTSKNRVTKNRVTKNRATRKQTLRKIGFCGDTQFKRYKNISEIQGAHTASIVNKRWTSPFINQWVVVEGIVTLDKSKEYQGFWLQQDDSFRSVSNASSRTSQRASTGIFIYHKRATIKRGQRIRLLAQVAEYHGLTELKRVKALTVCASNVTLPSASLLNLPITSLAELEALEGMRVRINQNLVVSDLFGAGYGLGNYGQFAISSRLHFQPSELENAQRIRFVKEHEQINSQIKSRKNIKKLDYLLVDDGYSVRSPKFIPFPNNKGFSADNPLRIGDKLKKISAILHSYGEHYILIPESQAGDIIINTQPRPKRPKISVQANIVVASMNVENYFNGSPLSHSKRNVGFPTTRGAKSYQHFVMQTQKLVAALATMNADVVALMELENDGYGEHSAIADLTRALNKQFSIDQQYRYIVSKLGESDEKDSGYKTGPLYKKNLLGQDEISVGILYRSSKVEPIDAVSILDSTSSDKYHDSRERMQALFNDGYNRPSLLQQFSINRDDFDKSSADEEQTFYLAVNHFKSKGRPCRSTIDTIQGNCNEERTRAALALGKFINKQVADTIPVLIMGDLNSYSQEDPLLALVAAGFKNLNTFNTLNKNRANSPFFSYSFQGYLGNLDHALANKAMLPFIRSIDSWHINSVEDALLKYDTAYAEPDAYRSSDHDPLVIGIQF
ncbi:hypothetical protein OLEAN_C27310 [Oleispira antarctica RB-8]|uniref:Endonuclease/exonuclease/phosphatase domain-containing protein n=1 Tax=Oleispira antarctica RB-8 TaxID=698738 RepID=R4YPC0_OLEAN|nr:hypothetical protein OLEAN_C27310 [Oleispira antarctica RB-8]